MRKNTIDTKRALAALYNMYNVINETAFESALPKCQIMITPTARAWGHYSINKIWKDKEGNTYHELNISADGLYRPIEEVLGTLVHEMVHHLNMENGVKDVSSSRGYHNKKFKEAAERTGLITIEHHDTIGYSITHPTEKLLDLAIERGWQDFAIAYGMIPTTSTGGTGIKGKPIPITGGTAKKPSSTRKYVCPCCGMSVRATRNVNIRCDDCDKVMIKA